MPTETERAWVAGLFDGEGSVLLRYEKIGRSGGNGKSVSPCFSISVCVEMTHQVTVERINSLYPGKVSTRPGRKAGWKRSFRWDRTGDKAVNFLKDCLRYFVTKREKAEIVIAYSKLPKFPGQRVSEGLNRERMRLFALFSPTHKVVSQQIILSEAP